MKKEKKEKLPKEKKVIEPKKEKKQTIIGMSITVTASAIVGVCIGTILRSTLNSNDRRDFDENLYKDDIVAIKSKYENALSKNITDLSTVLTPVEMLQISFDLLDNTNYLNECYGINSNNYSGDQMITSMRAVYNDIVYSESLSYGKMVKLGTRYFQTDDKVECYTADKYELPEDNKNIVLASYKDEITEMTSTDYEAKFGSPMTSSTNLLISSKTVKEGTTPVVSKNENGYKIEVELSDDATERYKTQIIAMDEKVSGVKPFISLKLICELDNSLYLYNLDSYEEYDTIALSVITARCKAHLNNKYYYEKDGINRDSFPKRIESYESYRRGI